MGATTTVQSQAGEKVETPTHQQGVEPKEGDFTKTATGGVQIADAHASTRTAETKDEGTQKAERPDYIPEKFWTGNLEESTKKLAASYTELEKKPAPNKSEDDKGEQDSSKQTQQVNIEDVSPDLLEEAAENYRARGGSLSAAMYDKLEAAGISPQRVNEYIDGQVALAEKQRAHYQELAGGEEQLNAALEWAKGEYSPEQVKEFDDALASGNQVRADNAVRTLVSDFAEAGGQLITGETGDTTTVGGVRPYASQEEQLADQRKPHYKTDPSFAKHVEARIEATMRAGGYKA